MLPARVMRFASPIDAGWNGSVILATNVSKLLLEHLTLTHGAGTDNISAGLGGGGGIYALNTTLYVDWCEITDNRGSSTQGAWGGGIYVDNQANGRMTSIAHSHIVSNTASTYPNDVGSGGGIYIFYGELSLANSQVVDNEASYNPNSMPEGGGLYLSYVSLANIQGNVIQNNRPSDRQYGSGGGICMKYPNFGIPSILIPAPMPSSSSRRCGKTSACVLARRPWIRE